ncbi:MAG: hypothetical protein FWF95_07215, partial [Syntrophorhabdaceae bacterium]|nr:hypothetical protein [Syntrophorhabdaceae bacterium]
MITNFFRIKSFRGIALAVVASMVFGFAACGGGGSGVSTGSGTSLDPYKIGTAQQLKELADRVNSGEEPSGQYYKLTNNIDLSEYGAGYNGGKGWTPIGTTEYWFDGTLDGTGKTIS